MSSTNNSPEAGAKAARTRQRILAATAREFARHGYGGTSLRRIAAGAGLQQGSLYFHFDSKDELVGAALREGIEFARQHVQAALDELDETARPECRLRAAIRAHLEALHSSHDRGAAIVEMVATLPPELRHAHAEHERRYAGLWLGILQQARDADLISSGTELRLTRDLFLGALNSTLRTIQSPDEPLEPAVAAAYELLVTPNHQNSAERAGVDPPHRT